MSATVDRPAAHAVTAAPDPPCTLARAETDGKRDLDALTEAMSTRVRRRLGPEHVTRIAEKLAAQGLLAGFEEKAPPKANPLLSLRWKVLVTDPGITRAITRPFELLF